MKVFHYAFAVKVPGTKYARKVLDQNGPETGLRDLPVKLGLQKQGSMRGFIFNFSILYLSEAILKQPFISKYLILPTFWLVYHRKITSKKILQVVTKKLCFRSFFKLGIHRNTPFLVPGISIEKKGFYPRDLSRLLKFL